MNLQVQREVRDKKKTSKLVGWVKMDRQFCPYEGAGR